MLLLVILNSLFAMPDTRHVRQHVPLMLAEELLRGVHVEEFLPGLLELVKKMLA